MARGTKFGRAVGWAAGVGISNWLLQRRRRTPAKDVQYEVPVPVVEVDVKAEVYRLHGETVSIRGLVEAVIGILAGRFARSKKKKPKAQWKELKRHIKSTGLKDELRTEVGTVNGFFQPRNLAAHAGMVITGVADATQIFRTYRDQGGLRVDLVTLESLREEVPTARAGFDAIRAIGRTLDDHRPEVLADMDDLTKAFLLGRT